MTTQDETLDDGCEHLFLRRTSAAINAWWWILGGIGLLVFAAFGFAMAIVMSLDQISMHAMTTLPTIVGIGALTAGWAFAHTPKQVAVGPQGITIYDSKGTRTIAWTQIGWATLSAGAMNMRRDLVIFDSSGKTLVRLSEAFDDFSVMVELVQNRIKQQASPVANAIQLKKAHKSAVLAISTGVVILVISGGLVWMTYNDQRSAWRLAHEAVRTDAKIERRFLAPNGITPRLEYRVTNEGGKSAKRNAEVDRSYWDSLEGATIVPVMYVPDEPSISRLAEGEPEEKDFFKTPIGGYGLAAAASVLCMFLIGAGVLQWYGWDVDLDSKTGRLSIKRFGTGV